jgi:preprotein translocase subunit SecB
MSINKLSNQENKTRTFSLDLNSRTPMWGERFYEVEIRTSVTPVIIKKDKGKVPLVFILEIFHSTIFDLVIKFVHRKNGRKKACNNYADS